MFCDMGGGHLERCQEERVLILWDRRLCHSRHRGGRWGGQGELISGARRWFGKTDRPVHESNLYFKSYSGKALLIRMQFHSAENAYCKYTVYHVKNYFDKWYFLIFLLSELLKRKEKNLGLCRKNVFLITYNYLSFAALTISYKLLIRPI